ncbi:MAG: GldG family protein [Patescibacteria group bacterium]|jgi:gliding-associated putative ABC transporter substrate-binding component GldG
MNKKRSLSLHSTGQIVLVLAIVIGLNFLLASTNWKLDLTQDKQYTLSPASRTTVTTLTNPVTIKIFFSSNVPQNMLALKQDVLDLVDEYKQAGQGNVIVQQTDPKSDPVAQQEVSSYGIPEIQYNVMGNEKFEVSTGYAGLAIVHGDAYETVPVVSNTDNLEYEITAAMQKMARTEPLTIAWLSDHDTTAAQTLQQALQKQYAVNPITLDKLDNSVKTLIIAGPTKAFTDVERYNIDQFVMSGGSVIFLLDGMTVNQQMLQASANKLDLETLLSAYGITVNNNIIGDFGSPENLTFGTASGMQVVRPYPFWPRIVPAGLNSENPITARLQSLSLPWPSSLTVTAPTGATATDLVKTSPQAYAYSDTVNISPEAMTVPDKKLMQQYTLATLVSGKLPSAFKADALPKDTDTAKFVAGTDNGHVAVFGNAQFIADELLGNSPENATILLNTVDALTQDTSLIAIRSRSALSRPLSATLTDGEKSAIKYGNIASGIIIVIIMAGVAYFLRKRRDLKAYQRYA